MAAYIAWKSFYTVNHPVLDAEHKQIIEYVNELYVAMNSPMDSEAKKRVLERLVQYTQTHFDHEEKFMREVDYPDLAVHKALHDDMRRRTIGLRTHLTSVTARDVLVFLKDWLLDHIQGEDKKYASYVEPAAANMAAAR
jgi:hemerythrin-like metal-binding protein